MKNNEENRRLYEEFLKESNKRLISNAEKYDWAILMLSSAGLLLVLNVFTKTLFSHQHTVFFFLSIFSYFAAILSIIVALTTGQKDISLGIKEAYEYYCGNSDTSNKKLFWYHCTIWLNRFAGWFYFAALTFTIIYTLMVYWR